MHCQQSLRGAARTAVTHQVNISAVAEQSPAMGEAFIFDRQGRLLARTTFA